MLGIALAPLLGLLAAFIVNLLFPKAQFRGYDVLPFFLLIGCNLITVHKNLPSFLPYGFFTYFILVIIIAVANAVKYKNLSLSKIFRVFWNNLTLCSIFWYIGLLFFLL